MDIDLKNGTASPWLEHTLRPIEDVLADLDAVSGRRCIKTHTPIDGIPVWKGVSYVTVFRHPIDIHFSMQRFVRRIPTSKLNVLFPEDDHEGFRTFLEGAEDGIGFDAPSLASIVNHLRAVREEEEAEVLPLHYADMQRNPLAAVEKIASHIGVASDRAFLSAVTQATSFDSMKRNADRFAPYARQGVLERNEDFFGSGSGSKWEGRLNDADLAAYRARLEVLACGEIGKWLEEGDKSIPA
jgi:aryl sulfotransferase